MSWSDLQPQARAAIAAGVFLLVVVLVWLWFVSPMRARAHSVRADIATAEGQLEQLEREIESIPPATDAERAAWRSSTDELLGRLGPESELTLFIESLVRLGDSQHVDVFLTSGGAAAIRGGNNRDGGDQNVPLAVQRVIGAIPGARFVPLNLKIYGDFAATSRFLSQIGRLGWVTDIAGLTMTRSFPEVTTQLRLVVFFRPSELRDEVPAAGSRPQLGQGGGTNG